MIFLLLLVTVSCANPHEAPQAPASPWKADPALMRECVAKVPQRWEQPTPTPTPTPDPVVAPKPNPTPAPSPTSKLASLGASMSISPLARLVIPPAPAPHETWPRTIVGDGNLDEVILAAEKQLSICERQMKRARERGQQHEFLRKVDIGGCELTHGDWCQAAAVTLRDLARALSAAHAPTPEGKKAAYAEFLLKLPELFDNIVLRGPPTDSRGRPTDAEENVLTSGYYAPVLDAVRTPDADYKFPLYAPPAELRFVTVDPASGKKGWRIPDGNGGWTRTFPRSEIEGTRAALAGKELMYLRDPLSRNDLQLQGAGIVNVREADGVTRTRGLQFAGDNGYPNLTIAKILRCELEQRGAPYVEIHEGKSRVKPKYLGGKLMRDYLHGTTGDPWAKLHELMEYTETIVFFKETENRGAEGRHAIILTPNVSFATDVSIVPFGFPVLLSANKSGRGSYLGFSQDTGGVIRGAHFDVYTGEGPEAAKKTNLVNRAGTARVLIPKACVKPTEAPTAPAPSPKPTPAPTPLNSREGNAQVRSAIQ